MALTQTEPSAANGRPYKLGTFDVQPMNLAALSGDTSGTVTSTSIQELSHILLPAGFKNTSAPVFSQNTVTLAFSVPAETAATLTKGGVTYTAVANLGASGNNITVAYTGGGTAGSEVVTVTGTAISVQIQSGTSTITQVRTAVNASAAAAALVTATGTSATTVSSATASSLSGGVTGGAAGTALLIGRP